MQRVINYGKHADGGSRKVNEVTLTATIEPNKYYDPKTKTHYEQGEHFSATGEIWNAKHTDIIHGGQCVDYIVNKYAKTETARNLRALWEVFHLQNMDKIPQRFADILRRFIKKETNQITFEKKQCKSFKFTVSELVTDYGTYTDGEIAIAIGDMVEVIRLSQGDEIKHPIVKRAADAIQWLYSNCPTAEQLACAAIKTTNAQEYATKKANDKAAKITEIKNIANEIIQAAQTDRLGDKWDMVHYELESAKRFLGVSK